MVPLSRSMGARSNQSEVILASQRALVPGSLALSCVVLLGSLLQVRSLNRGLRATLDSVQGRSAYLAVEREGLLGVLRSQALSGGFLAGTLIDLDSTVNWPVARDGIYYVIRPDCAACAINYAFLNSLHRTYGRSVVALAVSGGTEVLTAYARSHQLSFPILAGPSGKLMDMVPRHGVPLTIEVRGGRLHAIITGRIGREQQEVLSAGSPVSSTGRF